MRGGFEEVEFDPCKDFVRRDLRLRCRKSCRKLGSPALNWQPSNVAGNKVSVGCTYNLMSLKKSGRVVKPGQCGGIPSTLHLCSPR
jgi:hypothetical protein